MEKIPLDFIRSNIKPDPSTGLPILNWDGKLRSTEGEEVYQKDLANIKNLWPSVQDYILVRKFGHCLTWPEELAANKVFLKNAIVKPSSKSPKWVLDHSDYPHGLIEADFYYILWINSSDPEVIRTALELEKSKFAGMNTACYQNQPHNQSIGLTHFHFEVKK